MKAERWPDANQKLTAPEGDSECGDLWVMTDGRQCLSRWRPTWREWFAILFGRPVWVCVNMAPQPPIWITAGKLGEPTK